MVASYFRQAVEDIQYYVKKDAWDMAGTQTALVSHKQPVCHRDAK